MYSTYCLIKCFVLVLSLAKTSNLKTSTNVFVPSLMIDDFRITKSKANSIVRTFSLFLEVILREELKTAQEKHNEREKSFHEERKTLAIQLESQVS